MPALEGGGGGFAELVGGSGTVLEGGGGGFDELVGGTGIVLAGGGGAAPPEFFLTVGGRGGGEFDFAGVSLIAPVLRNFGIPPANKPAKPGGPPPMGGIGGAPPPPPGLLPPDEIPPEPPPVLVSIKAALRSFFSESLTFLSFLPFSIDFNKSLLPFVEGGGILATGGGGGAGTGGGGGGTIFFINKIKYFT